MSEQITPLELTAIQAIAMRAKKHEQLMLNQIAHAHVLSRKRSSAGFITYFTVPENIPSLKTMSHSKLLEIYAEHSKVPAGAEFLIWFENGKLKSLEGYSFVGEWPKDEFGFQFARQFESLSPELLSSRLQNKKKH